MISFTGFSSTTDLTGNSDLEFVTDVDVGDIDALIVDVQTLVSTEVKTQVLEIPFVLHDYAVANYDYNLNYTQVSFRTVKPPDLYKYPINGETTSDKLIIAPRDKLDQRPF